MSVLEGKMRVGLAMFTVRESFKKDPILTMKEISSAGYKIIEIANHNAQEDPGTGFGFSVMDLKKMIDDNGIKIIGAHVMPSGGGKAIEKFYYDDDQLKKIIEYYVELGGKYLSFPIDFFPSRDYLLKRCDLYNHIGSLCKLNGIRFLYHNHFHEFALLEGRPVMDMLIENTDPGLVGIELDVYWTILGAFDPVEKIHQYGKRINLLHQKDFPLSQVQNMNMWTKLDRNIPLTWESFHDQIRPEYFTEVGKGLIKIQDVIDAGNEFNIPYILIEQDYSNLTEFESIKVSMDNFKKMRDLEWD
jgi:sugar phosphate isomerase/epimerase